jgi:hypothetical protein
MGEKLIMAGGFTQPTGPTGVASMLPTTPQGGVANLVPKTQQGTLELMGAKNLNTPTTKAALGSVGKTLTYPSDNTDNAKARVVFSSFPYTFCTPRMEDTKDPIMSGGGSSNIKLYVPGQFTEKYSATWGMDQIITAQLGGMIPGANTSGQEVAASLWEAAHSATSGVIGAEVNTFKLTHGVTQFPGEFLVFHKGDPIQMGFHFELLPRSSTEAGEITNIVNTFKRELLPVLTSGYLNFPALWNIYFSGINGIGFPDTLNKYMYMALVSVNATYSGGNQTALVYHDNYSVMIALDLQFHSVRNAYLGG